MWGNDMKCKYMFMFPLKNLARKGLSTITNAEYTPQLEVTNDTRYISHQGSYGVILSIF